MSRITVDGAPIRIGYEWRQRLSVPTTPAPFPSGVTFTSHVRANRSDTTVLATLTTDNGGLVRISDTEIDIVIPVSATTVMQAGTVVMDIVRTDTAPDVHLGFELKIPVILPVTRGLAS